MGETWQERERRDDAARQDAVQRNRLLMLKALLFTLAIVSAPFLALLYSIDLALIVLAVGLAVTIWLTWNASQQVGEGQRSRLRMAAGLNAAVLAVVVAIVIVRLAT